MNVSFGIFVEKCDNVTLLGHELIDKQMTG